MHECHWAIEAFDRLYERVGPVAEEFQKRIALFIKAISESINKSLAKHAQAADATPEKEHCTKIQMSNGATMVVHGIGAPTAQEEEFFREIGEAARRRYASEHPNWRGNEQRY